jgi:hypothetical protein
MSGNLLKNSLLTAACSFYWLLSTAYASPHEIDVGPEFTHLKRIRKGGTKQTGALYGLRATYDHIGRYLIYWGLEGAYSSGMLKGHAGNGTELKSHFTQGNVEGRIGYTLQSCNREFLSITPFVGVGYYRELNHYVSPSPIKIHFDNQFCYGAAGVLLRGYFTPELRFGLNATARWSFDGKVKITHDPNYEATTIEYMQKMQGRVSLPLWYQTISSCVSFEWGIAPFFEYRHYGRKVAVPFDFIDTRIKSWGCDVFYTFHF